jgi:uncharacterized protein with ACT and thioredoxin-like domain
MLKSVMKTKKEELTFQVFFLKNDEDQGVEVIEREEIDFEEVKRRLKSGESVFITRKQEPKARTSLIANKVEKDPWYLSRI